MRSNGWRLPFNIALGIHIMVLVGAVYLPAIFKSKPKFADVYSVSLVNIAEPETAPPVKTQDPGPPKVAAKPPPPAPPPKIKKEVPPVEEPPKVVEKVEKVEPAKEEPVAEEPAPPKAVSLKPLKQKKVIKVVKEETPPKKPEVDRREIQKLAEALKEEEILTEKARLAREAFDQERKLLADSLKASEARQASSSAAAERQSSSAAASASGSSTLLEAKYNAEILNRLMENWSVPEYMPKDLLAVVVIIIKQDGDVATWEFESKSGDRMYDQFVNKAIEASKPFPPIPPAMKKQTHEIGFRFRPGGIQ